ncbi:MAG: hypothetical protein D6702_11505 [Planctomycetota bacterium]|nr:MAG: hypothetical protein D6702_11505 [Planctomycetota bacterium]
MFREFEPQGLVMLALTDESTGTVERFMENNEMPYPIGCGAKSARAYGVQGIPSAFLIDADGVIVWQGHPGAGGWEGMIPKLLAAARDAGPGWDPGEVPEALAKAAAAARAGKMKEAVKLAERARKAEPAAAESFLAGLGEAADRKLERARALAAEGRYFEAGERLRELEEAFKGTDWAARFSEQRLAWVKDKQAKALAALDRKRVQANADARSGKAAKAAKALAKLAEEAAGTPLEAVVRADLERARKTAAAAP